jgi:hypothetical protein
MASADRDRQDALYTEISAGNAAALRRLARAYEADPDKRGICSKKCTLSCG